MIKLHTLLQSIETKSSDHQHFEKSQSIMSSSSPITLKFIEVTYRIKLEKKGSSRVNNIRKMLSGGPTSSSDVENPTATIDQERVILEGITGMVAPGQILAVLGPSGSGKSTLLNALSGRLHHGRGLAGKILANDRKITRQVMKNTGFVAQDDVLFPHLTVRETLVFCSLLRLPNSMSKNDKISVAESVIQELGLSRCEDTIIGNSFVRGISGGERKRVSIAHEMLMNPSLLILDEPTSGLDSTAAFRLVETLAGVAAEKEKTVVMSVHQPSSRVYQMFEPVLVLSEGRCIYFGKGNEAMKYFESVGFSPSFAMNPADFLLDLANGVYQHNGTSEKEQPNVRQRLVSSYNSFLAPKVKAFCAGAPTMATEDRVMLEGYGCNCIDNLTSWYNQFNILLNRNLKGKRYETFNSLRVFQVITAAFLAGFIWWHSDYTDIHDRLGLLFFISIFWGVFSSFNAVFSFPQERSILVKERASGMYTLSSYFMARITADLPMELILPTLFFTIVYWMTWLRPEFGAFILSLIVVLSYVLVSQGLGLAVGALIMDAKQASTVVTVTMLAFVLTGGYYVHKVPSFLSWMKYISTTYYSYGLLINVQYGDGKAISSVFGCSSHGGERVACKFIEEDIMENFHPTTSIGVLLIMFVGYRLLAYTMLRRIGA